MADAGAGLGLPGLPTGNISSGDIRDAVADLVSDPAFRGSAGVLSGVLRCVLPPSSSTYTFAAFVNTVFQ